MGYMDGQGINSIDGMLSAAAKSGVVGALPLLFMTSGYRPGGPHHGTYNATDWGNNAGDNGSPQMDAFAAWLERNYGPVSLEIIHVNQDGSTIEWKNGQKMPMGWYGAETLAAHRNHVHWAITNFGLAMVDATDAQENNEGVDIVAGKPTINFNESLNTDDHHVRDVRWLMAARGMWYNPVVPLDIDGRIARGKLTDLVKSFQTIAGLKPDGIVGPATWKALVTPIPALGNK